MFVWYVGMHVYNYTYTKFSQSLTGSPCIPSLPQGPCSPDTPYGNITINLAALINILSIIKIKSCSMVDM